jgi:hypothetical protein
MCYLPPNPITQIKAKSSGPRAGNESHYIVFLKNGRNDLDEILPVHNIDIPR